MTQEEKAKRYDDAIERARIWKDKSGMPKDKQGILDNIFPELKESEDERIKEEIKVILANTDLSRFALDYTFNDMLVWLEKQGESYTKRDVDDAYLKGITVAKNEIEKQYEANYQIRKDIATFIFNYKGDIKDRAKWIDYLGIKASFVEKQGESNPYSGVSFEYNGHTWGMCARDNGVEIGIDSELKAFVSLDKSFVYPVHHQPIIAPKFAMDVINEEKVDNANKVEPKDYNGIDPHFGKPTDKVESFDRYEGLTDFERTLADICIGWIGEELGWKQYIKDNADVLLKIAVKKFNSVQDAPFEQKPAWSEEDKVILGEIIDFFENGTVKLQHDLSLYASWLKSLRPQNTWKPSDEQIEALEHFVRSVGESGYASPYDNNTKLLYSLLGQLKKLIEE